MCRLVRTDISSAGALRGQPDWQDIIPQHEMDLMQWATALQVYPLPLILHVLHTSGMPLAKGVTSVAKA